MTEGGGVGVYGREFVREGKKDREIEAEVLFLFKIFPFPSKLIKVKLMALPFPS
jgi:hypothetical protein